MWFCRMKLHLAMMQASIEWNIPPDILQHDLVRRINLQVDLFLFACRLWVEQKIETVILPTFKFGSTFRESCAVLLRFTLIYTFICFNLIIWASELIYINFEFLLQHIVDASFGRCLSHSVPKNINELVLLRTTNKLNSTWGCTPSSHYTGWLSAYNILSIYLI